MDEKDILKLLAGKSGKIKGQPLASLHLDTLEGVLEKTPWIRDAELYLDNKEVLHVTVTERTPVARVFAANGKSFYIDVDAKQLALSDKMTARVPVFTNFPTAKVVLKKDSILLRQVLDIASFINADPFWLSQVAQVDITTENEFEVVPVVGNHIVRFGDAKDIDKKFRRLRLFYDNIVSKTGFDKYKAIDVQFAGQVVATRGYATKTDSLLYRKSVEKLLQQARDMQNDTLIPVAPVLAMPSTESNTENVEIANEPANMITNPNPVKVSLPTSAKQPVKVPTKTTPKQPKAVMKKTD